jgi:hypothetical protein
VVLLAAESASQAEHRKTQLQTMLDESQRLMETIYETSNKNPAFRNLPEADRLELYSLAEEFNQTLSRIKKEGETV